MLACAARMAGRIPPANPGTPARTIAPATMRGVTLEEYTSWESNSAPHASARCAHARALTTKLEALHRASGPQRSTMACSGARSAGDHPGSVWRSPHSTGCRASPRERVRVEPPYRPASYRLCSLSANPLRLSSGRRLAGSRYLPGFCIRKASCPECLPMPCPASSRDLSMRTQRASLPRR
jgi:hypothetical protein